MKELHKQCPPDPTSQSKKLLDVFIDAFDLNDEKWIKIYFAQDLISKRMQAYLQTKGLVSKDLSRKGLKEKRMQGGV